jgi:hypothetical protein
MAAECGLPYDHDKHYEMVDGVLIKCDGDSTKRLNYDGSQPNKTGIN